ncbi:MAG: NYN domain-containing protein [Chloroflexi bacterium]|nr:NYN domain-containing protein [Chloroflexota bacterium]
MAENKKEDVAVFIDFENIYISVRNEHATDPNFELLMDKSSDFGRVIIARAYADWYRYPRVTSALYAHSIEPMYVPTYYYEREDTRAGAQKNSVDIHLVIDAMKTLYGYPNISTYILATGDRDFIPLVNTIRQYGKKVVVIGVSGAASTHLAQSADEFILYRQLLDEGQPIEKPKDIYKTLVEAVHLARKRGNLITFATLKLVMMELLGGFEERDYRDAQGKPFTSFKDFAREAEKKGMIQIFTSGTVNEVFLPGEDPYKLSHFVSEPPGEMEREVMEKAEEEGEAMEFTPEHWKVFRDMMQQFDEPVLFVQIYNTLRGLRNQELIDLSNTQIKMMIKQAISEGMLTRISRGTHRYYQLNPDHALVAAAAKSQNSS